MKITNKFFDNKIKTIIESAKITVKNKYSLNPGNNIDLICEILFRLKNKSGSYVECGVYQGTTLFTVAEFLKIIDDGRSMYGLDTFEGFPNYTINKLDHPSMFKQLFDKGEISENHFLKAKNRTNNFEDLSHLTQEYFCDVAKVVTTAKDFKSIKLIKGIFVETLLKINEPIAVLFLDCDLYQSYIECLMKLYPSVESGGFVIFDEYFSLKYPGARIAVNEFFKDKTGEFEVYMSDDSFERWCFIKQ